MSGQMRTFLDQTGGLWASGALYGKLASVFSSTGTGGGQEQTITSTWTTLAHGMVIVPIGYGAQELFDVSQVRGGTPYGATTIAGGDGSRQPSKEELLSPAIRVNMSQVWPKTERLTPTGGQACQLKKPKPTAWVNGQVYATPPEIAEAIFEVAKYDEKLAEQIWEEGSDEVLVRAFEKRIKTRSSGVSKPSNVKTSKRFPRRTRGFSLLRRVIHHRIKFINRTEAVRIHRAAFSSSVTRCGDCSDSTLALRSCSEL
jgi:hypothetical protein